MSYPRMGLGDALSTGTINALVSNGASLAQATKIDSLMQRTADGTTGNVDPQYASLVIHRDGSIGPTSDAKNVNAANPYWQGIVAANRYLLILDDNNNAITTVGAISAPAAAAIMATYVPVAGSTSSQVVSTTATAPAEAVAKKEAVAAAIATPVSVTSNAPPPSEPSVLQKIFAIDPNVDVMMPSPVLIPFEAGAPAMNEPAPPLAVASSGLPSWAPYAIGGAVLFLLFGRRK